MITLTKSGNAIVFTFDDNDHYLNDGTIEVPVNSLTLVTDESQMATFRKSASNDIFISATYDELGMSKADLESWFKENACGSTGGSVTPEEVQDMIDESISGKADTSDVQEIASDVTTVSGDVNTLSGSVNALTGAVNTLSGDVSTLSGSVDSNHNAITAVVGDVQTLSGQVQGDETILTGHTANTDIHVTASDKQNWNNKSDFSGSYNDLTDKPTIPVVPTNVSAFNNDAGYATSGYVNSSVSGKMDTDSFDSFYNSDYLYYKQETNEAIEGLNSAVSGKVNTTDFNTYSASTDNRLSEDEEVTAAALNSLNSNKQDKLTAGSGITISNNVISCTVSGGSTYSAGRGIDITNDIISLNLPISAGTGINSVKESNKNNNASGDYSHAEGSVTLASGIYSHAEGQSTTAGGTSSHAEGSVTLASGLAAHAEGYHTEAKNVGEHASGFYNVSKTGSTADNKTLFSVGNGTADDARHNAFEIRNNGDIYITKDGSDVKLQDQLGGGGLPESAFTAYTASTDARLSEDEEVTAAALNSLNDALSDKADTSAVTESINAAVSGKADTSAFTAHTADTTIHTTSAEKASWNGAATNASNAITALGGLKLVQLTQAQYDALATKDASTVYFITGSN